MANSELRKSLMRKLRGKPEKVTRASRAARAASRMSGVVTKGVIIADINQGAWSYIGQPPSPSVAVSKYAFLE